MFLDIYKNELKKNLKSFAFYIFFGLIFFAVYMFTSNTKPGVVLMGVMIGKENHNAPLIIAKMFTNISVFGGLITMIIVGRTVTKDFNAKIHDLFFTIPMSKATYLGGRFFAGLTANLLIYSGVIFGFIFGCLILDAEYYGTFQLSAFILPVLFMVIPNLLLIGSIFFSLATLSRKMVLTYISGILFLMIYAFVLGGFSIIENDTFKILADPFGIFALNLLTKFWTVADINNNLMPLHGLLILNRLIWLAVTFLIIFFTWKKFKFVSVLEKKEKNKIQINKESESKIVKTLGQITTVVLDDSFAFQIKKLFFLIRKEFKRIVFHPAFIILTFIALQEIVMNFVLNITYSESNIYPLTSWYLKYTEHIWAYMVPLTILFGGMIIWRERDNNSNEFYDTLPMSDWMSYLSKLFTIMSIQVFYIVLAMLTGIVTQVVFFGYYDIELGLYIKRLFGIELINYWHIAIVVFFIQNLVPNKILGFFLSALYFIADLIIFNVLDVENILFRYGNVPKYIYSNINGFGQYGALIFWYTIYWLLFGLFLVILTSLLWRRNNEISLKFRVRVALQKMNQKYKFLLSTLMVLFILTGCFIGYNKYILNDYMSKDDEIQMKADYEKKFGKYEFSPQPKIIDTKLKIDIYPEERDLYIKGTYVLKNETQLNLKEIYLNLYERNISKLHKLELSVPSTLTLKAKELGFRIYKLETPLAPDEEIKLEFDLKVHKRGFTENHPMNELAKNGTCIMFSPAESVDYFPGIGFNNSFIITKEYDRKKHGLPKRPDLPSLEAADRKICFANSNKSTFDAIVSTSSDQVIVSNGDLIKKWNEANRNYFHYKSDIPMYNEFIFSSGKYEAVSEKYKHITIEVYYDKKHYYNIDRLINGVKKSLDYCSSNYSPFPFNYLRIVEIPDYMHEGAAARSQPTVFIWSEDEGFVNNMQNPENVDMVFGICTHEMAHQWWAYQVMPAWAEGAFMLTETMCQYVEIMCQQKEYGVKLARKQLEDEMNNYLKYRKRDRKGERPLMRAYAGQQYLNYPKSTITMYALQDYIGEENVNLALKRVTEKFGNREDIYAISSDVVNEFKAVTPDSFQYLITDLFENVTLYENEAVSAKYEKLTDGKFKVDLTVKAKKFYADSIGTQSEAPLNDYIYIGVIGENEEELYLKKHKFTQHESEFEIFVDKKPVRAGIDPFVILIDRDRKNNLVNVESY